MCSAIWFRNAITFKINIETKSGFYFLCGECTIIQRFNGNWRLQREGGKFGAMSQEKFDFNVKLILKTNFNFKIFDFKTKLSN